jgi:hypothetical protein
MTFITVIRTGTFPVNSVDVDLTGLFRGNLIGNVLDGTIVQATEGQFDNISAKTLNGTIIVSDNVCISAGNILQVDTINDKSGLGITIEGVTVLNGLFTSNICIDASKYLLTDHIEAKTSLITVHSNVLMSSTAEQLRFSNGIEIGSASTSTDSTNAIAIGKGTTVAGTSSIAIGYASSVASSANDSIAIGHNADVGARRSIAIGRNVKTTDVYGRSIAIGYAISQNVTSGGYNTICIGSSVCPNATSAPNYSIAIGFRVGQYKTSWNASENSMIMIGSYVFGNTPAATRVGFYHIAIGTYAMCKQGTTTAPNSRDVVAIGSFALYRGTTGRSDVVIGKVAGSATISAGSLSASYRICIGSYAGYCINSPGAVSIGTYSMGSAQTRTTHVTGSNLIAIGYNAMTNVFNPANNNIAIGTNTLGASLDNNIAMGTNTLGASLDFITNKMTGYNNIALGHSALTGLIAQHDVIGIGQSVVATGHNATIVGSSASGALNTVAVGKSATANFSGAVAVGSSATASAANCIQLGQATNSGSNATLKFRSQIIGDEDWIDTYANIAAIDGSGNIYKTSTLASALSTLGNITNQCITGTRTGAGNVLLTAIPMVPLDEVWGFTIDVVGRETGSANIFYETQSILAHNNAGNVDVTYLSTISSYGVGAMSSDTFAVVGNLNGIEVTVTTASTGTTNWTGKLHITSVI